MPNDQAAPLTFVQKGRLLIDCLPVLFFGASTICTLTIWPAVTGAPLPRLLAPFLGVVTLSTAWIAVQRLRDVLGGCAAVAEDRLLRLWRGRGVGTGCYGTFERLGTLRMRPHEFVHSCPGARYSITYSSASKLVWSLEKRGS